jgi:hypothetical protein
VVVGVWLMKPEKSLSDQKSFIFVNATMNLGEAHPKVSSHKLGKFWNTRNSTSENELGFISRSLKNSRKGSCERRSKALWSTPLIQIP